MDEPGDLSPPFPPMTGVPPPEGWILVTDCSCGEHHLAPDDEGYQGHYEYIDSKGVAHELP